MLVFEMLLYITLGMYLLLLLFFIVGLFRIPRLKEARNEEPLKTISVIVAFRNEAENLPALLACLKKMEQEKVEFVFCDDASVDDSANVIRAFGLRNAKLLLNARTPGKKGAILSAVEQSGGEILVFTDADCCMGENWLHELTAPLQSGEVDMCAGPVRLIRRSFFSAIQDVDQLSLSASSAAAAANGSAFMCSAANMAVMRSCYPLEELQRNLHSGGDDVFLLHALKQSGKRIVLLWNRGVLVWTNPADSLSGFFSQRIRWAGKSKAYTDAFSLVVASLVFFMSLIVMIGLLLSPVYPQLLPALLICVLLKAAIDFLFLFLSESRLGEKSLWQYFLPAFVFHLLYIPPLAVAAMVYRPFWKGRKIN